MKVSSRGRYGTRLLLDIALHRKEEPVLLKDIAQRQNLPLSYLEHLIAPLIAGGIIRSTRGAKGGMSLAKPPAEIKLSQVINILEGSMAPVECLNRTDVCDRVQTCATRDLWGEVKLAIDSVLEANTLEDLVEKQRRKDKQPEAMYYI